MTKASQSEPRTKLKLREKIYTGLGLTMVIASSTIWILTEALAPEYTKATWDIASPGLTLLTLLVGSFLVLRGTKKLINAAVSQLDNSLEPYVVYRIIRWITLKSLMIVLAVLGFFFNVFTGQPSGSHSQTSNNSPITDRGDGAWDVASDHYYDKEPPPPFS